MTKEEMKIKDKFIKTIAFNKNTFGAWSGSAYLKDGYCLTVCGAADQKAREAKSMIKDRLYDNAVRIAAERGTELVLG